MSLVLQSLPVIQKAVREPACDLCVMSADASPRDVCVTAQGSPSVVPRYAVVGKFPPSQKATQELGDYLTEVGLDPTEAVFMGAVKCRSPTSTRSWRSCPTR